ncbi:hypothetical protein B0H11DRAFT_2429821 [Mycena galericulata]|nr:hypothetical protein B0H11DRAFT_2429821 [Mycena galericulata]
MDEEVNPQAALLDAFRTHYSRFQTTVTDITHNPTDAVVIARLGDDLDEFARMVHEHSGIFNPDELDVLQISVAAMQNDIQLEYRDAVDASHNGRPTVIQLVPTGGRGRPRIVINPDFLRWAYSQRSTASIHRFLGVSRDTVRRALLEYGITTPQSDPFVDEDADPVLHPDPALHTEQQNEPTLENDDLLDPEIVLPANLPADLEELAQPAVVSFTGPLSSISDDELDLLISRLRLHFRRAGLAMLDGMLRRLGHRVQRERIRECLLRIDPVRRIFERIRIRRRHYSVPGPNSLWHHDGQHGLSVHNVRIERLWVDVTVQVGATWAERFTVFEIRHGLDINNPARVFAQSWNQHRIQIRGGPNRSPADMFYFDMHINGVRGNQLPEDQISDEELEVFGIDWAGLRDDTLLQSQRQNNPLGEGATSWNGRVGPPALADLSSVIVEPLPGTLTEDEVTSLYNAVQHLLGSADDAECIMAWTSALAHVRIFRQDLF